MGLLDIFISKSPLDEIINSFRFLTTEYGFQLIKTEQRTDFKALNFMVYRNDTSKLQLEISGDTTWFHCEIRRLVNGTPANYSDSENSIGFESLAVLESDNKYEHLDYFAGGSGGLTCVLRNTVSLFKRHKKIFTTDSCLDVKRVQQLRDDDFEQKFGSRPDLDRLTYFSALKGRANQLLLNHGYRLLVDSDELSPFDSSGMVDYLTFQNGDRQIKIKQADWRDDYFIYKIEVNGNTIFEIDLRNDDTTKAVDRTIEILKQQL